MDLLHGLCEKLRFIESMHQQAIASFVEKKRQIENSEGDFDSSGWDPESWDGTPPFLEEWQEADEAINLLGQACLSLVQSALKEYLDGCVALTNGKPVRKGKESWFDSYRRFFDEQLGIDWSKSQVPLNSIEEINLARNDAQHAGIEFGMTRYRDARHQERFPSGIFADVMYTTMAERLPFFPVPLKVTADSLNEAIKRVGDFCSFLEAQRLA
jgi:hypothetical protein